MKNELKVLKELNILYAEDDINILSEEQKNFEFFFNKVFVASDGQEALQIFNEEKIDLAILDIQMPKKTGIEVAKEIREKDHKFPIIMLTAFSDKEYLLEGIKIKLEDYVLKPININKLIDTVYKIFEKESKQYVKFNNECFYNIKKSLFIKNGNEIYLGEKENKLLKLLVENKNDIVKKETISYEIWNLEMKDSSYRNLIRNLRNKIGENFIETIPAIGLKLKISF